MFLKKESVLNSMNFDFRFQYETLRSLMNKNGRALQLLNDLEADLAHLHFCDFRIKRPVDRLFDEVLLMAQELNILTNDRYSDLYDVLHKIQDEIRSVFKAQPDYDSKPLSIRLDSEKAANEHLVGGKTSGLNILQREFSEYVPKGFAITTAAYKLFLKENQLDDRIRLMMKNIDVVSDYDQFKIRTETIRHWILSAKVPDEIKETISVYSDGIISENQAWAVRSSSISEDSWHSFAGQFESILNVSKENLENAYRQVLAGRFLERAVMYRLHCGFREIDTPMAVLFMPMIHPIASGVINTIDPANTENDQMVINAVPGLSDKLVKGTADANVYYFSREPEPKLLEARLLSGMNSDFYQETLDHVAKIAFKIAERFGYEMDIEWAVDKNFKIWLLQARKINLNSPEKIRKLRKTKALPISEGGITIFPGRAEGKAVFIKSKDDFKSVIKGCVAIVENPTPDLTPILHRIAALVAEHGSPVGHLATLLREFPIPSIFQLGNQIKLLNSLSLISVNATNRKLYKGSRWPGIRELVLARIADTKRYAISNPLYNLILKLNLTDPYDSSFKPKMCRSLHDALRFIHEMSIRSMFSFGDKQKRGWINRNYKLKTDLPVKFFLIDLDGSIQQSSKLVSPDNIDSVPFQSFWKGMSDKRLMWPERWHREFANLPSDFQEQVFGGSKGPRRPKDPNYLIIAKDYLNINARFAYHYSTVDAIVGPGDKNNRVHFRFRGGGSSEENLLKRACFLELVLRQSRFGVDRRGNLVTAWLRRYPQNDSENALELLGRLMVCARQLDIKMSSVQTDNEIKLYVKHFLDGNYSFFS